MKDPTIADVLTALANLTAKVESGVDGLGKAQGVVSEDMRQVKDNIRGLRYDFQNERDEYVKLRRRVEQLEERTFGSVQH